MIHPDLYTSVPLCVPQNYPDIVYPTLASMDAGERGWVIPVLNTMYFTLFALLGTYLVISMIIAVFEEKYTYGTHSNTPLHH